MSSTLLDHKIDEYIYSKINPNFRYTSSKDECELYAPHFYKGICRLCQQSPETHKKWNDYHLVAMRIQKWWRLYSKLMKLKIKKLSRQVMEKHFGNIFCEDIVIYISKFLVDKQVNYKDNIIKFKTLKNW